MRRHPYYALVASLPALPHFTRAERLPLSRRRLDERLRMLAPEDHAELTRAESLTEWQRHPQERTNEEIEARYLDIAAQTSNAALLEFVEFRMDQRTVMAALRRRRRRLGYEGIFWGVGRWTRRIESHWNEPALGLGHIYPWIPEARDCLESGRALDLERLLMDQVWRRLSKVADEHPFGFETVFAFVFRWDISSRWLAYDADVAARRFRGLVGDAIREFEQTAE